MRKLALVAVGGNALIRDSKHSTIPDQIETVAETCTHIASIIESGWDVIVTHGNGPQVGFLLLRSEIASKTVHPIPLDTAGADTQGAIGYWMQQALHNEFVRRGMTKKAVTVVTQVVVKPDDPAFLKPSKPVGPFYSEEDARRYQQERGWAVKEDAGRGWRRVVPSPLPYEIAEIDPIKALVNAGFVVVAGGGGGIPVVRDGDGMLRGVEGVIDKDYASALLAAGVGANAFVITTAVEKVALNYNKPNQMDVDRLTVEEARKHLEDGQFPEGSMGPKIRAAIQFLEKGGDEVIITSPEALGRAIEGTTGTRITR
ncbi:MAG TPA: carbamate kinase [Bacillota bacterium]|nr:carbamate kinase [Bacillota bacterium]HNU93325.1 carbamate kinase [Bacillota bacterium]HOI36285.1 carbamate kinase [Bacillota bacterium]HPU74773.1 carbamate kinase [Bacillota bacterium]